MAYEGTDNQAGNMDDLDQMDRDSEMWDSDYDA